MRHTIKLGLLATAAALLMGAGLAAPASAAEPAISAEPAAITLAEARAEADEVIEVDNPLGVVVEPGQLVIGTAFDCWAYVPAGEKHAVGGCDTVPPYRIKVRADCASSTDKYSVAFQDNVRTYWTGQCSLRALGGYIVPA